MEPYWDIRELTREEMRSVSGGGLGGTPLGSGGKARPPLAGFGSQGKNERISENEPA